MAPISSFVIICLSFVFIGSVTGKARECTGSETSKCIRDNIISPECSNYKKTAECVEGLLPQCKDDVTIERVTGIIKFARAMAAKCPGLADDECPDQVVTETCGVPSDQIQFGANQQVKTRACHDFKGKMDAMRTCTLGVKAKCVDSFTRERLEDRVRDIDYAKSLCAGYAKNATH